MFSIIATVIGFIVDTISLYQMIKGNQNNSKESNNTGRTIMLVIGTLAIIIGLMGIFLSSSSDKQQGEDVSLNVSSIASSDEDPTSSEPIDVSSVYQEVQDKSGKVWIENIQVLDYNDGGSSNNKYDFEESVFTNTGANLNHAVVFRACDNKFFSKINSQYLDFYLNGEYKSFSATLALLDKYKDTKGEWQLVIKLDEETVQSFSIASGFLPELINLDVSGKSILRIQITNKEGEYKGSSGTYETQIAFCDAYFSK